MSQTTIAIINADLLLLKELRTRLTNAGYEVMIYIPIEDTYHQLRRTQPALIVLEVETQGAGMGWTLLTRLRRDPQTTHIPLLATTQDHPLPAESAAIVQAHGCDTLELPGGLAVMPARVAHLLTTR